MKKKMAIIATFGACLGMASVGVADDYHKGLCAGYKLATERTHEDFQHYRVLVENSAKGNDENIIALMRTMVLYAGLYMVEPSDAVKLLEIPGGKVVCPNGILINDNLLELKEQ